jgi:signal transduction histidine kinase
MDFVNLFARPPGDLLYFMAVIAISQAGLFMALGERLRQPQNRSAGRYTLATLGIVLAWVVLMLGALFAIVSNQDAATILPPLERAANVMAILLVGWAFLTADHDRWGRLPNVILLVLMVIIVGGYIITGVEWPTLAGQTDFNLTVYGVAWTFIPAVLSLVGLILIATYFRLVTDAPLKLIFFLVLLLSYGGTLAQVAQGTLLGNYPGLARLAFLVGLPIVPAIIYRAIVSQMQAEIISNAQQIQQTPLPVPAAPAPVQNVQPVVPALPTFTPMQRDSVQLLKTLGLILEEAQPADVPQRIVSATLEVLKADVGALLNVQDANYADITAAYNQTGGKPIAALALNLEQQPTLVNAIERRLQRPLYPDRNVEELKDLYNRLDIDRIGPAYFQPLLSGKELVAILVVALPFTGRELEEHERELLKGIAVIAGNLLALSYAARDARLKAEDRAIQALVQGMPIDEVSDETVLAARQEMQASLQLAREQVQELTKQVTQLKLELDAERSRMTSELGDTEEGLSVSQRILALNEEQETLLKEREQLANRLKEAETALASATSANGETVANTVMELLRRERDELTAQRDNLQMQLESLRSGTNSNQPLQDMLNQMTQEKARLEADRAQLIGKLDDIEAQLNALGIENGAAGLAQLIAQLTEQRADMQAKIDTLTLERDALLNERSSLEHDIQAQKDREARIQALQTEIKYLASDREALTKQRDALRAERDELLAKQDVIKLNRTRLLAEASAYQVELAEAHQNEAKLQVQLQQLADERSTLTSERDRLLAEKQALETERDQLLARFNGDRDRLQQLGENGVGSMTRMIQEISEQRNYLEQELNETRARLADVENQLSAMQISVPTGTGMDHYNPDLILGMVQELRTPLTSIIGYIDLLLDESAGFLGKMQRDFLQRVSANISRLALSLDELTRIASLDTSHFSLTPVPLDVISVIEDAISDSTPQFREKNLTVLLNLDDNAPEIRADRDAVTQIIKQLLNNAYLASPVNSQIIVTAHQQDVKLSNNEKFAAPTNSLLISVEDRGGGISQEDIARVFARKYKADNPLVQGLGDTGVGLSIARTLAEAHGGALWLETRPGIGSIFYVALPVEIVAEPEG